ncbi:hypothetical protein, unknown function [Leishmania donovani]|uniref:Ring finger domain/Zinc finger, C3HC4 type (RING finger) containing protein, putative n=1 Tax=Leishmania donovani TaxID=5661 RepID=E9B906_LEIDO|nr:hypothetical protein, unknown function [Leishmania donovani]AYU76208.1 Ring finger domain/Zinc finger, C3HC4 type (RING finger) containing protein, putative [Leishmania donovani]CBZ31729.1 hypothetical protein, unknown function [Leishmania donovani]
MRDSCRARTPSPSHLVPRDCEGASSNTCGSGGGDPTVRPNSTTARPRQRPHHHQQGPRRGRHFTDTQEGNGKSSRSSRGSVGGCVVPMWMNAPPNVVGGVERMANNSHQSSLSSFAAAVVNRPPGTSTSPTTQHKQWEAAARSTSGAASTSLAAAVAFGPSACVVASGAAVSGTQRSDHSPTGTAARVAQMPLRGAPSAAATPQHDCPSRDSSGYPQGSSPTSLRLHATASTATGTATCGNLADAQRRRRLKPPPIMSDVASASGRRSCSCPSTRSATAIEATIASSPLATYTVVAASPRAAAAVTHPARTLRSAGSPASPSDMLPQGPVPPPNPDFKPLGLWSTSPASAAASTSATTLELKASTATASGADVGSLLTHEMDGGVVIVDPHQTPDDLVCGVCMCVCRQPTAAACGHLFCRRCLQSWMQENRTATCPLDRTPIRVELLHTDARAQRQINALRCRCPASLSRASQWALRQLGSASHVLGDRAVEDEADNDDARGDERARREHPRCTWAGCVSDAEAHLRQCPYIIIECPFAKRGCSAEMPRVDMAGHLKSGVADHLLLVSQALDASTEQYRVLQGEVEVLRQRCPMHYPVALPDVPTGGPAGISEPAVSLYSLSLHGADVPAAALAPALVIAGGGGSSSGATPIAITAFPEEVSPESGSPTRVVGPFGHGASAAVDYPFPVFSHSQPPYPPPHHGSSTIATQTNVRRHAATDDMLLVAAHRMSSGHDATMPMPADTTALCTSPHFGAPPTSVSGANTAAAAPTFALPAGAAAPIPAQVASAPPRAAPVVGSGHCVDRFVWVITDMASRQAPCYSRSFTSHGLSWYVGIDTTASWEQCGVYLFTEGHEHRVDFRVILYHEDPARDVVHVVRDWQEDYIGKGWGPLRFINRFTLEQDGFLVSGCLRVGIEVVSGPY